MFSQLTQKTMYQKTCLVLLTIGLLSGCSNAPKEPNSTEIKIKELVSQMTLEEKVAMLHGNGKFTSAGVARLGIPELKSTDGPLGIREELQRDSWAPAGWNTDSAMFFPAGGGLSATWNVELARRYGEAIGQEARARDKDVLLAPAVNLIRSPLGGRNFEYFSEDPLLNKQLTVPYVLGVQEQDVAACVKHYAINNQETNRGTIDVLADERTIREMYLPVFEGAVKEGKALSVMSAYNKFRGEYLSENDYMLNQVLRKDWGFSGLVMSDWGAVHSTVPSALGGLDIEMGTEINNYNKWYYANPLLEAVKTGQLAEEILNEHVENILRVMMEINMLDGERKAGSINTPEHRQVAYDVAVESIVLLKNDGNLLPLDASKFNSIAVIGDNATRKHANGGFGAGVKAAYEVSPMEGLQSRFPDKKLVFAQGYEEHYLANALGRKWGLPVDYAPNDKLVNEAAKAAKSSDIAIVFIGSNRLVETEAEDRKTLRLPFGQEELVKAVKKANPNTIVVVIAGAPYDLNEVQANTDALVWSWFNGSEGGNALADILAGKINPSGKLPVTFPVKLEDSPAHATNSFPGSETVVEYKEGILVGYRWFDTKAIAPLYPFGYGLSYTSFEYSDFKIGASDKTQIRLDFTLENSGPLEGKETVQLYVSKPDSRVPRAQKELKAFKKLNLAAGAKTNASFEIPVNELAYYDEEKGWVVESGTYTFYLASSSRDIRASLDLTLQP